VFVVDAAGNNLRRLTATPEVEQRPSFSPDGALISFVSNAGTAYPHAGGPYQAYLMRTDGSQVVAIPGSTNQVIAKPVWSPARRFMEWEFDPLGLVYQSDVAGTRDLFLQFLHPIYYTTGFAPRIPLAVDPSQHEADPAWSADGRFLAFTSRPSGTPPEQPQRYEVMRIPGNDCSSPLTPLNLSNRPLAEDGNPVWLKP
jgi:Tol biopolymer transport system component